MNQVILFHHLPQQQSSAISETAASLEEITAMLQKTSDNTNDSAASAKETQVLAGRGEQTMHEMVRVIDEIKASTKSCDNGEIWKRRNFSDHEIY